MQHNMASELVTESLAFRLQQSSSVMHALCVQEETGRELQSVCDDLRNESTTHDGRLVAIQELIRSRKIELEAHRGQSAEIEV
jgi:hypothetical protein